MYRNKASRTRDLKNLIGQQERIIRAGINSFVISLDIFELDSKQDAKQPKEKFNLEKTLLIPFLKEDLFTSYISSPLIEFMLDIGNDLDFVELVKFVKEVKENPRKFMHKTKKENLEEIKEDNEVIDISDEVDLDEVKMREKVIEFRSTFGGDNLNQENLQGFKGTATFGEIEKIAPEIKSGKMEEEKFPKKKDRSSNKERRNSQKSSDGKQTESQKMNQMGRAQYFFNKFIKPGYQKSKELKEKRKIFKIQRPKTRQEHRKTFSKQFKRPPTANTISNNSSAFSFPRSKRSLSLGPNIARKYIIKPKAEKVTLKNQGNLIDLQNYELKANYLKDGSQDGSHSKMSRTSNSLYSNSNFKINSDSKVTKLSKLKKSPKEFLNQEIIHDVTNFKNNGIENSGEKDTSFDGFTHGFSLQDWENDIVAKATPKSRKTKNRRGTLTFN